MYFWHTEVTYVLLTINVVREICSWLTEFRWTTPFKPTMSRLHACTQSRPILTNHSNTQSQMKQWFTERTYDVIPKDLSGYNIEAKTDDMMVPISQFNSQIMGIIEFRKMSPSRKSYGKSWFLRLFSKWVTDPILWLWVTKRHRTMELDQILIICKFQITNSIFRDVIDIWFNSPKQDQNPWKKIEKILGKFPGVEEVSQKNLSYFWYQK